MANKISVFDGAIEMIRCAGFASLTSRFKPSTSVTTRRAYFITRGSWVAKMKLVFETKRPVRTDETYAIYVPD